MQLAKKTTYTTAAEKKKGTSLCLHKEVDCFFPWTGMEKTDIFHPKKCLLRVDAVCCILFLNERAYIQIMLRESTLNGSER